MPAHTRASFRPRSLGARSHRRVALALILAAAGAVAGCAPVFYTVNLLSANRTVSEAREAGAAEHAPYEYYYADAFLKKAEEEASEGQYQDAIEYARTAESSGVKARDIARRHMQETGR